MLMKLAFKNVGKSFRDYAVYFLTLVFGVSIFYMFNSIYAQKEIMSVTDSTALAMSSLTELLSYVSVFVAVILGFLIVYANNFFIRRRKKELGVYMTLGMSRRRIALILLLETSLMAASALVVGLFLGVFGSQLMSVFTARLFEADLTGYRFVFSIDAAVKSILYFAVIFLVVALFNILVINRVRLIDLLYGGRKNETQKIRNSFLAAVLFIVSVILLIAAYCIILHYDFGPDANENDLKLSIALGAVGTFLFFFSLSGFLIKLLQGRKRLYYKNLNMFVIRQLSSKINTNFISVSVVCLILFLVIVIFSSGYSAQNILSAKLQKQAAYDFSLESASFHPERDAKDVPSEIFSSLPDDLRNSSDIKGCAEYALFNMEARGGQYGDYALDLSVLTTDISASPLYFMKLSDFNRLRQLGGLATCTLSGGSFLIAYEDEDLAVIANQFIKKELAVTIGSQNLRPMEQAERMTFGNRYFGGIVFVVEDELTSGLQLQKRVLNINCRDEMAAASFQKKLQAYQAVPNEHPAFLRFDSRQEIYADAVTDKALASFLAIYLGFVFMITCAAVLAVQQLSEAEDNRERYRLLRKLGTDRGMLNRALFGQVLSYFLAPLILAIVHSAVGLRAAYRLLSEFGQLDILSSIIATAGFVVLVYGAYFILTYVGSRNTIGR